LISIISFKSVIKSTKTTKNHTQF